jgi:acetone carboxylase gamma subunit
MDDSWTDYCTGSSYKLEYVSVSKLVAGALPSTINMMSMYVDKNRFNNPG